MGELARLVEAESLLDVSQFEQVEGEGGKEGGRERGREGQAEGGFWAASCTLEE